MSGLREKSHGLEKQLIT
ncbi:hypothetical protein Tempeh5N_06085 [Lactococcus lactis subsp. lactis]|nr:hypothetical protein [Lactococcus sp. SK2-659]MCB6852721.1 hypothetical protein [Lactococcus lactis]MCI2095829.1 hypothetical protein [Lactococcus lactis]MCI2190300.1 hypothetical protein [Lactococcus lactis]UTG80445.1 hypothetical protein MK801_05410 [Lactococcus lactis]